MAFAVLVVLIIVTYLFLDKLLCLKSEHGIRQSKDMYAQPRNTIDVVFMGSSHIHCDVNTALLWEKYGIASYDYSAAEQPLWITYYYLKEICKYQDPKLIVIDVYTPARHKEDHMLNYLDENLLGVRFSVNKIGMMLSDCETDTIWDYFPSMTRYHSRYWGIHKYDWEYALMSRKDRAAFKGYTPYYVVDPQEEPVLSQDNSGGITIKSEIYLQRIIEYCDKHDIELFLMVSPYVTTDEDELVYNRIHEIADMYGLEFNSTNYFYSEMDLNFEEDFNDHSHLNYRGSCKFSDYLGSEIKQMYDIPDRRGDKRWESWDRHAEEIKANAIAAGFHEE